MKLKRSYIGSVGGLTPNDNYWSSSQNNANNAWNQNVGNGGGWHSQFDNDKGNSFLVRAVRAFEPFNSLLLSRPLRAR